jgi:hypothetical protein
MKRSRDNVLTWDYMRNYVVWRGAPPPFKRGTDGLFGRKGGQGAHFLTGVKNTGIIRLKFGDDPFVKEYLLTCFVCGPMVAKPRSD